MEKAVNVRVLYSGDLVDSVILGALQSVIWQMNVKLVVLSQEASESCYKICKATSFFTHCREYMHILTWAGFFTDNEIYTFHPYHIYSFFQSTKILIEIL